MARIFTVTLYTSSATSGEGATGYLIPDFSVDPMVAEKRLMQFEAASCRFRIIDKGKGKTARYWSNRIQRSVPFTRMDGVWTNLPIIEVWDTTDTDAAPVPLFTGFVEKNQYQWENEVITGFTAVSQLSYAERFNANAAHPGMAQQLCNGATGSGMGYVWTVLSWAANQGDYISMGIVPGDTLHIGVNSYEIVSVDSATTLTLSASVNGLSGTSYVTRVAMVEYSGLAAPLARRHLRLLGNISPNLSDGDDPDVIISDRSLGTDQDDTDWNHVLRVAADAGTDPADGNMLSDFVPSVDGDRLGFTCVNGKLYRVDAAAPSGREDGKKVGVKLTQITTLLSGTGEAVTRGTRLFRYVLSDGSPALLVIESEVRNLWSKQVDAWLDPYVSAGTTVGAVAGKIANFTTMGWGAIYLPFVLTGQALASMARKYTATPSAERRRVITSATVLDVGDGTNDTVTGVGATVNAAVPGSCYGNTFADSVCVNSASGIDSIIYFGRYFSFTGITQIWFAAYALGSWTIGATGKSIGGEPAGGMAAWTAGGASMVAVGTATGVSIRDARTPELSVVAIDKVLDRSPSRFIGVLPLEAAPVDHLAFLLGNDEAHWYELDVAATPTLTEHNLPTTDRFKLCACDTIAQTRDGQTGLPIVYKARDGYENEYLYAGWLYVSSGNIAVADKLLTCQYPIPAARSGDFRPPVLLKDATQNVWRFTVLQATVEGTRLVVDFYQSGLFAVPFVHYNFKSNPITIRQSIDATCRSFGCYLKLMALSAPADSTTCKIMSRFSWTPTALNTISTTQELNGRIDGAEYYLGAQAQTYGEDVKTGTVLVNTARHVYPLSGLYLTPAWARTLGAWIVSRYPENSANYLDGRRLIECDLHLLDDGAGNAVTPGYHHVYGVATFSKFSTGNITALLIGLGFNRATGLYRATLIEYQAADVDWTTDADDQDYDTEVVVISDTLDVPTPVVSATIIHTTDVVGLPTNVYEGPPVDGPCAYAFPVHYPHGLNLNKYLYTMVENGTVNHGGMTFSHWTDAGGDPGAMIDDTRAQVTSLVGLTAEMQETTLYNPTGLSVMTYWLAPGRYWIVVVVDREDIATTALSPPPVVWMDALAPTKRWRYLPWSAIYGSNPGLTWFSSWDAAQATNVQRIPLIYSGGDA